MVIGVTLFVVIALIVLVWLFIEIKRFRHKFFAIFLVVLILFSYLSFTLVLKGKNADLGSVSGIIDAGKLYFSWLGSLFGNFKTITSNAVKLDWQGNETSTE